MKNIKSANEYKTVRKSFKDSMKVSNAQMQAMIVWGLSQYEEHGQATVLTNCRKDAITCKSVPCATIEEYVQAHANVTWSKNKRGAWAFVSKNNKDRQVKAVTGTKWFDGINVEETDTPAKNTDILKMVQSVLKQVGTKQEKGVLNDTDAQCEVAESMLKALVASMEGRGFSVTK